MVACQTDEFLTRNYITKSDVIKRMGVSPTTLSKYHSMALKVSDFKNDYVVDATGSIDTRAALTDYQAWCLEQIISTCKGHSYLKVITAFKDVEAANKKFNKEAYQRFLDEQESFALTINSQYN